MPPTPPMRKPLDLCPGHPKLISIVAPLLAACAQVPVAPVQLPPAVEFGRSYDRSNPFAKILRGELPIAKVYEDAHVLAFMDNAPASPGHVLVISKTSHARNILEVQDRDIRRIIDVARLIGRAELAAFGADGFTLEQNNGFSQSVPHLHIHVIPRYLGNSRCPGSGLTEPVEELEPFAAALRVVLTKMKR